MESPYSLNAIIELQGVRVCYKGIAALDGISLSVGEGATGLLGPNGAGKSTLIRTLLGFNRAESGRVRVLGMEMPRQAVEVRQCIGYMPEKEVSSPKVSAVSFLTYCGRICGMTRVDALERAHEVLNYVKLGDSRYRTMETYSTGMLQRVKLAQAILHDPKLLMLDEPTNGLDPDGRIEILELVKDIAQRPGVSVLVSSHLLPDVQHVCPRVIMINRGRVVREGTIADLTPMHMGKYEVRVRDKEAQFVAELRRLGISCIRLHPSDIWLADCPNSLDTEQLFRAAESCGTQVRHFRAARRRLEDVFLQAVGKE